MNNSNSTDGHVGAASASWTDLLEALAEPVFSDTTFLESTQEDLMVSAPGDLSSASSGLHNFNAVSDTAFTPAPTTSTWAFTNFTSQINHTYPPQNVPYAWSMPGPYTSFVAPGLLCDPNSTPCAAHSASTAPNVVDPSSSATSPVPQDGFSWPFGAGRSTPATSSSPTSGSIEEGPITPEYGTLNYGVTTSPAEWDIGQAFWPTPAAPAPATSAPVLALGKRRREEPQGVGAPIGNNQVPPQKRSRGSNAEGMTRHNPVARIPKTTINSEPKEAGRGAERLATPNARGVHHRPLQGPRFQQGWMGQTVDGVLIWVEGSVEEEPVQQEPMQQEPVRQQQEQQQEQEAEPKYHKFPDEFEIEHQALLVATQADRERGSVREIRCQCCPDKIFKTWDGYKRHCKTKENHPLEIDFCDNCGDFFARKESLKRHREHPPRECIRVTRERADEKRRETLRVHGEFLARLREFLRTGEEYVEAPFSQVIKGMYPESSKKNKRNRR